MKKFSREAVIFMFVQALFTLAVALSATFVNVFMWRLTSNITYNILHSLASTISVVITFVISGFIARNNGITTCIRIGILSNLLFYVPILLLRENSKDFLIPLGIIAGIGTGFYYYAINTLTYHYTDEDNRRYYLGVTGALGAVMGTLAPLLSGWIIISNSGLLGYYIVFLASLLLFLLATILTYFLRQIKEKSKYNLKEVLTKKHDKAWNSVMVTHFLLGLKDGTFFLVLGLLTYMILNNELDMGKLNMISSIVGIAATYYVGKRMSKSNEKLIFLIGAVLYFISALIIVIYPTPTGVIVNSILNAAFACFWSIPFTNISYEIAGRSARKTKNIGDYIIAREIPLAFGRVLSLLIFFLINLFYGIQSSIRIILPGLAFMVVLIFLTLSSAGKSNAMQEAAAGSEKDGWKLIWSDEFDGKEIDKSKWNHINGGTGFGNDELQFYTDRPENSYIEDGRLVIKALKEDYKHRNYTSAKLVTNNRASFKYGRFEIRAKLPEGQGIWPAIWMMPVDMTKYGGWPSCGEIDIMELIGNEPDRVYGTIHFGNPHKYTGKNIALSQGKFSDDFHIFTLEWEEKEMRWYVDGEIFYRTGSWYSREGSDATPRVYPAPFDREFYLILNLAVGGRWPGYPDDTTVFPQTMEVDYIRVYQKSE